MADTGKAHQPDHLSVVATSTDGIDVLTVAGEIDHDTAPPLQQALDLSRLGSPPRVVVDMRQVTFMDSAGINLLVAAHQATTQAGGWLRLASAQDPVMRTLQIVELDTIINCYPTLRDALHR
ncbi:STAS domain-containing protein [Streptomyces sp. NPDC051104]|uniref:STAS domain-containing protein n=1 Tax=Streptomyces sp. NPDC051104 TaxID=3155044 RepID=UPI00342BAD39